jgi:formamidopyrimidine-DNA glycosylase
VPELPEVESVRRSLVPWIVGARVLGVNVRRGDVITHGRLRRRSAGARDDRGAQAIAPSDLLVGATIVQLLRRGKQLLLGADSGRGIVIHLGMSGQVRIAAEMPTPPGQHTHVLWSLETRAGACTMLFDDPRRFGGVILVDDWARIEAGAWRGLGPDALTATGTALAEGIRGQRRAIKVALLDQSVLAGVGNIYADEACCRAGVDPRTPCVRFTDAGCELLAKHIREVLAEAIALGGSTVGTYADAQGRAGSFSDRHAVYGRAGQECLTCGRALRSAVVAGRTTVWCQACQGRARARG